MMSSSICTNHALRRAGYSCRRCGKPICDICIQDFGGRFCSALCSDQFSEFQERVVDVFPARRRRFSIFGCLRTFIISLILLAVTWAALVQLLGTGDPAEMGSKLIKMIRLAF